MRFFASKTHYSLEAPCHARTVRSPWLLAAHHPTRQRPSASIPNDVLDILAARSQERGVRVAAYTLMSNHFHRVAIGDQADAISLFMMEVGGHAT